MRNNNKKNVNANFESQNPLFEYKTNDAFSENFN